MIFASDLSFPLGVRLRRIQRHGCFCANPGRSGAQGEKEDSICRPVFCTHQLGPSASGDGEPVVEGIVYKMAKIHLGLWG